MASGADRFKRFLARVPKQVIFQTRLEIERQANAMASEMRARAPKGTGTLAGTVRVRLQIVRAVIKAGSSATDTTDNGIAASFLRGVREGATGKKSKVSNNALHQEFGTAKMKARPFFFPVYNARRASAQKAIKAAMKRAIEQAT